MRSQGHSCPSRAWPFQEVKTAAKLAARDARARLSRSPNKRQDRLSPCTGTAAVRRSMVRTNWTRCRWRKRPACPMRPRQDHLQGRETFVAHSCGHDIHMASWLGTAKTLVSLKDQWHGTLMFIGSPRTEEIGAGAWRCWGDGLFTRFPKPDFAFGLHCGPFPRPYQLSRRGSGRPIPTALPSNSMAAAVTGAAPQQTIDPC